MNVCPSNYLYRGRSITESNIQDYISNIVSKYLPAGLSPWQICVIPVVKTIPLARSEAAARPSTVADLTIENDIENEQQQQHPQQQQSMSSDQTTV